MRLRSAPTRFQFDNFGTKKNVTPIEQDDADYEEESDHTSDKDDDEKIQQRKNNGVGNKSPLSMCILCDKIFTKKMITQHYKNPPPLGHGNP